MSSAQEQRIDSPLHPAHSLTLQKAKDFRCDACFERYFSLKDVYCCGECNFNLDLECAKECAYISLDTNEIKEEPAIEEAEDQYFLHGHTLELYKNIPDDRLECGICGKYCSDDHAYCCFRCSFFLHPSCSSQKWLRVLDYLFHPQHPLTLLDMYAPGKWSIEERKCIACRKYIHCLTYACLLCRFYLHVECSVIKSFIKFQGHDHLIHFRDNVNKNQLKCSRCNQNICESYAFTCLDCDFNLHLTCGPLPYTIQDECHMDPLVLTNSPVLEEDETDEFYCHACEEERDSQLPVYYCAECHFIAEIKCVFSQVILSLKGGYGDVELRNTRGFPGNLISINAVEDRLQKNLEQGKRTSTLRDIVDSLSLDEMNELFSVLAMETVSVEEDDNNEDSKHLQTSLLISVLAMETVTSEEGDNTEDREYWKTFSSVRKGFIQFIKSHADGRRISEQWETFLKYSEDVLLSNNGHIQFMKVLNRGKSIHRPWESQEEVVNVGDYMVPPRLVPILTHLLSKQEDISAKSFLSPRVKLILFNILCECIYSMINTRVVDITKDLLLNWWTSFKILQFARFETSFAFNHLKRVAQAYFGLFVKEKANIALDNIDRDIAKHCEDIEALKEKRERIKSAESTKSSLIEESLKDASVLKYERAGKGLLNFSA